MIKFLLYLDVDKSGIIFLKPGDKVQVNLTVKAFRQLQDNAIYGGWEEGMEQVSVWATLVVNGSCLQNLTTYQYNSLYYLLVNIEGRISFACIFTPCFKRFPLYAGNNYSCLDSLNFSLVVYKNIPNSL